MSDFDMDELRQAGADSRTIVKVNLSEDAFTSLTALQQDMGLESLDTVIRNGVRLLRWYHERIERDGYTLYIAKDKMLKEVEIEF